MSRRKLALISAISLFVALGSCSFAIRGTKCLAQCVPTPSSTRDHFDSDHRQILLNVAVTDKAEHPISGLEASDFKIFDNKQPQKIIDFRAVNSAHPDAVPIQVQIIIDAMNSDAVTVARVRDGLGAFLKQESGRLAYSTSIWLLENAGLTQIAGPSRDGASLLTALNSVQPRLRVINRSAGTWGEVERTGQAIKLLKEMVAPDSRTPGRKLVLFLSPGWPMLFNYEADQRSWIFDDIVRLSNGLRESCISLYALDPSGFGTTVVEPSGSGSNSAAYDGFLAGVTKTGDAQYPDLSLQVLSEHSGGQVIVGGNDVREEINTALRGAGEYYALSFEAAPGGSRIEYHAIRIAVDKPHLKIHTTAGYYVNAP